MSRAPSTSSCAGPGRGRRRKRRKKRKKRRRKRKKRKKRRRRRRRRRRKGDIHFFYFFAGRCRVSLMHNQTRNAWPKDQSKKRGKREEGAPSSVRPKSDSWGAAPFRPEAERYGGRRRPHYKVSGPFLCASFCAYNWVPKCTFFQRGLPLFASNLLHLEGVSSVTMPFLGHPLKMFAKMRFFGQSVHTSYLPPPYNEKRRNFTLFPHPLFVSHAFEVLCASVRSENTHLTALYTKFVPFFAFCGLSSVNSVNLALFHTFSEIK